MKRSGQGIRIYPPLHVLLREGIVDGAKKGSKRESQYTYGKMREGAVDDAWGAYDKISKRHLRVRKRLTREFQRATGSLRNAAPFTRAGYDKADQLAGAAWGAVKSATRRRTLGRLALGAGGAAALGYGAYKLYQRRKKQHGNTQTTS